MISTKGAESAAKVVFKVITILVRVDSISLLGFSVNFVNGKLLLVSTFKWRGIIIKACRVPVFRVSMSQMQLT